MVKLSLRQSVGRTEQRAATDHEVEFVIINRCSGAFLFSNDFKSENVKAVAHFFAADLVTMYFS